METFEIKRTMFSGGEVHCKITAEFNKSMGILVTDYTMNGFMELAQSVEIMRRHSVKYIHVIYPYFPYARQDRVMAEDESFSLKIFCDMVNALKLDSITIWDPHSDVTPALLNNCNVLPQWEIAKQVLPQEYFMSCRVWVSPDAGAFKKLSKLISDSGIAIGTKIRDINGHIVKSDVLLQEHSSIQGKSCIIVDDICDGGRTFIELAKALKNKGASEVILYITHGIFSQGIAPLLPYIDHIYTTNSFAQEKAPWFLDEVIKKRVTIKELI